MVSKIVVLIKPGLLYLLLTGVQIRYYNFCTMEKNQTNGWRYGLGMVWTGIRQE